VAQRETNIYIKTCVLPLRAPDFVVNLLKLYWQLFSTFGMSEELPLAYLLCEGQYSLTEQNCYTGFIPTTAKFGIVSSLPTDKEKGIIFSQTRCDPEAMERILFDTACSSSKVQQGTSH